MELTNNVTQSLTSELALKDMDSVLLSFAIMDANGSKPVRDAIEFAAYLHRGQARRSPTIGSNGRAYQPTVPYIQHPLRNTVRLIRWGVTDTETLIASLLHDTVEDCVFEIVEVYCGQDTQDMPEKIARNIALRYIERAFSPATAEAVKHVSNPLMVDLTRSEREAAYIEHVRDHALGQVRSALVKVADISDNVWSLHLTDPKDAKRLVRKYAPLDAVLSEAYARLEPEFKRYASPEGMVQIRKRMTELGPYLQQFQD